MARIASQQRLDRTAAVDFVTAEGQLMGEWNKSSGAAMINHHHINRKIVIAATPSKNAATPNKMPIIWSSFIDLRTVVVRNSFGFGGNDFGVGPFGESFESISRAAIIRPLCEAMME
jgi:hypothetical protein